MKQISYCLICLTTEVKMYCMNSMMKQLYYELISYPHSPTKQNMYACYECAYLLQKYEKFKIKCQKAYNILCSLSGNPLEVTEHILRSIDRKQLKLRTELTMLTIVHDPKQESDTDDELDTEELKSDPITFDNQLTNLEGDLLHMQDNQLDQSTAENVFDQSLEIKNSPERDINDDQFTQTFQLENPNYKSDGKLIWLTIKTKENNKSHSQSPSQLGDNCPDNEHYNTELFCVDNSIDMDNIQTEERELYIQEECDTNECNETNYIEIVDTETEKEKFNMEKESDTNNFHESINKQIGTNKLNIEKDLVLTNEIKEAVNKQTAKKKLNVKKKRDNNESHENNDSVIGSNCNKRIRNKKCKQNRSDKNNVRMNPLKKFVTATRLTLDEIQKEFLLRKESKNYKYNPYKCDLCYRGFTKNDTYVSHLMAHTSKNGAFQCSICKLCYTSKHKLCKHMSTHKLKISCNLCSYVCSSWSQSQGHQLSHTGKKFTCKECGTSFKYYNSLLTHRHLKHGREHVCDLCGSTFTSETGLAFHKKKKHKQEENEQLGPRCDECSVHFASELAWKRHRVLCSRHQVQWGCQVCGEEFDHADSLKIHEREHVDKNDKTKWKNPQTCHICKETCSNKVALSRHLVAKHPLEATLEHRRISQSDNVCREYVCEICGKAFRQRTYLALHQRMHSDEKPYSCLICGMRTNYKTSMALHQKIHTEEDRDKFQCDICGRPFDSKNRLIRHIKVHMNIRPYKCAACDKSFSYRCDERTHYKHVHENVPYPKKNDDPTKKQRTKRRPYAKIKIIDNI